MSESIQRPQRLRQSERWRSLVRETFVRPSDLVWPLFVKAASEPPTPVPSMPGVEQRSADDIVELAERAERLGLGGLLLFGIPDHKDASGSSAWDPEGPVPSAIRAVKKATPELLVWADVCLCEYTSHGHCGILDGDRIDGDSTLPLLSRASVEYARAGADAVAPSDMFDGRVAHIRAALDSEGFTMTPIVSYAVKYASSLYGPFRDAAGSSLVEGDRRSHQMDPANAREALRETRLDLSEDADILMVKPASYYLDVIRAVRGVSDRPVAAYQVSGEFSMIKAAAANGWLDERAVALESLVAIRRAGADCIVTYFAPDAAAWLSEG